MEELRDKQRERAVCSSGLRTVVAVVAVVVFCTVVVAVAVVVFCTVVVVVVAVVVGGVVLQFRPSRGL